MADVKKEFEDILQIVSDSTSDHRRKQKRAKRQAEEKYQQYREGASELANDVKDQASQLFETSKAGASQLYANSKDTVSDLSDTASEVGNKVSSYLDRHSGHIFSIILALLGIKLVRNLRKLLDD